MRYIAAVERALSFIMIYTVYSMRYENNSHWWMKLYCFGTALYFLFMPFSLVASRIGACFKSLEIIIVPGLMREKSRYRKIFMYYFFILSAVMFMHSLSGEAENGNYVKGINPVNFPYVSVFDADSIHKYRSSRVRRPARRRKFNQTSQPAERESFSTTTLPVVPKIEVPQAR